MLSYSLPASAACTVPFSIILSIFNSVEILIIIITAITTKLLRTRILVTAHSSSNVDERQWTPPALYMWVVVNLKTDADTSVAIGDAAAAAAGASIATSSRWEYGSVGVRSARDSAALCALCSVRRPAGDVFHLTDNGMLRSVIERLINATSTCACMVARRPADGQSGAVPFVHRLWRFFSLRFTRLGDLNNSS